MRFHVLNVLKTLFYGNLLLLEMSGMMSRLVALFGDYFEAHQFRKHLQLI